MAWTKLIRSGSDAQLNNVFASNAVTASYFTGNGAKVTGIVSSSYASTASYCIGTPQPINAQTGTSYTLAISDTYKLVTLNNASAITLTVPSSSTEPFDIGVAVDLAQLGDGQVTVTTGSINVVVNSTPGRKLRTKYAGATLRKVGIDTWLMFGDLSV